MKFKLINGLPVLTIIIEYQNNTMYLEDVLLDTGCGVSIFDTDMVEDIGLTIDRKSGRAVRMNGIGGKSELCYQQIANKISIYQITLNNFTLQLGMTKIPYGFSAILGADFCDKAGLIIDFKEHLVRF